MCFHIHNIINSQIIGAKWQNNEYRGAKYSFRSQMFIILCFQQILYTFCNFFQGFLKFPYRNLSLFLPNFPQRFLQLFSVPVWCALSFQETFKGMQGKLSSFCHRSTNFRREMHLLDKHRKGNERKGYERKRKKKKGYVRICHFANQITCNCWWRMRERTSSPPI